MNHDGTINSADNPATGGSVVSLFVTGLGTVTPPVSDGAITPYPPPKQDLPVNVLFWPSEYSASDSIAASVLYAGPAPLAIEGLGQINVVVPPVVPRGPDPTPPGSITADGPVWIKIGSQDFSQPMHLWLK